MDSRLQWLLEVHSKQKFQSNRIPCIVRIIKVNWTLQPNIQYWRVRSWIPQFYTSEGWWFYYSLKYSFMSFQKLVEETENQLPVGLFSKDQQMLTTSSPLLTKLFFKLLEHGMKQASRKLIQGQIQLSSKLLCKTRSFDRIPKCSKITYA